MNTATLNQAPDVRSARGNGGRSLLRGLPWLVWRQHRALYLTLLILAAATLGVAAWQRSEVIDFLAGFGWPHLTSDAWRVDITPFHETFNYVAGPVGYIPILIGVFAGAPLLASDLETGHAKIIAAQSVTPTRWLSTKLLVTGLVVTVCTALLSFGFGWWSDPLIHIGELSWYQAEVFDNTGPVPVALSLLITFGGALIGAVMRRSVPAMALTFGFAVFVEVAWSVIRMRFGQTVTAVSHGGPRSVPHTPDHILQISDMYITSSGQLLDKTTCLSDSQQAMNACLDKAGVVGSSIDYVPYSQMSHMQWLGGGTAIGLAVVLGLMVLLYGRKRLV